MRSTQVMELEPSNPPLTEQECRLLILACRGLSNRELAEQVALAESTVKKLLHRSVRKLDASDKFQAVAICLKQGFINLFDIYPIETLINCLVPPVPEKIILTQRERLTLALAAQGLRNQQIAERMNTSVSAVKMRLSNIFDKLGARNRTKAVWLAMWQGLLYNLEFMSPEDAIDMMAASGVRDIEIYLALIDQKLGALEPDELRHEPYVSNLEKLKTFRNLLWERLTYLQSGTRIPASV